MALSDNEVLEILNNIRKGNYENDNQEQEAFDKLFKTFPNILDLIRSERTPEQILEEAKKLNKPILL